MAAGKKKTVVTKSSAARARSPSPDDFVQNEIPPIPYDSEEELLDAFDRMRQDLRTRVVTRFNKEKPTDITLAELEQMVLEQFFDGMVPFVLANCTIAGIPFARYKRRQAAAAEASGETQAFDEDLREKVIRYQDQYFDAREENVRKRRDVPEHVAKLLQTITAKDSERLAALEEELPSAVKGKPRPSAAAAPPADWKEAQANFEVAQDELNRMLVDIPTLKAEAEGAARF